MTSIANIRDCIIVMKVLFVDQSGKLGGAELSLLDVAGAFGTDSSVLLFQDGPFQTRLEDAGIDVRVLESRSIESRKEGGLLQGLKAIIQAFPLIQEIATQAKSYDLIYANTQKAFVFGTLAGIRSKRPVVYHLRDILSTDHFSQVNIKVAVFMANHLSRLVIANSQATAQSFIESGGKADLVKVIYNGFNPEVYQTNPIDRTKLRHELNLEGKFVIGQFSRLSPWKGQHVLIEALAQCPESVVGLFVGDALFGEDEYVQQIKQQVKDLGLTDRVHFLGFRSDVANLMGACDVVAHTSTAPEPFGRVIVEAMLCEKTVIAAAAGGAAELVTHGKTGWSITPGDATELAKTIRYCFENPTHCQDIAIQARKDSYERFHVDRMTQEVMNELKHIL
jgi:glycosyltransferase involved in cell wall biosynthesis